MRKRPRLRQFDELRKENLRRVINYVEKWIDDPRVSPDYRQQCMNKASQAKEELAMLEAIPESEYRT